MSKGANNLTLAVFNVARVVNELAESFDSWDLLRFTLIGRVPAADCISPGL